MERVRALASLGRKFGKRLMVTNGDNQHLNVLVIDDEQVARQMVKRLLADAEIQARIEELDSASAAIQVLSDRKFDVALLDYRLPDGTAASILKTLRKYGRLQTPIIVMTAHAQKNTADESMNEGAQDYLSKEEITADSLERAIRYSIQRHQLTHELQWSKERERREKELRQLQASVNETDTTPSAVKSFQETFERFVERYRSILLKSLDEAAYDEERDVPELTKIFAHDLGELHAGPKDVIDIHTSALKQAVVNVSKQKENALTAEGRIVLIQVMGSLVTFYRK